MNYAFTNGKILNGTKDMQIQTGLCILVRDGKIYDIVKDTADLDGYKIIDLQGHYILPGLINMHVHLAGSGKPQKKQRDNEKQMNEAGIDSITNYLESRQIEAIYLVPQCPSDKSWGGPMLGVLKSLIDKYVGDGIVDKNSIYIFGGSMGGMDLLGMMLIKSGSHTSIGHVNLCWNLMLYTICACAWGRIS